MRNREKINKLLNIFSDKFSMKKNELKKTTGFNSYRKNAQNRFTIDEAV